MVKLIDYDEHDLNKKCKKYKLIRICVCVVTTCTNYLIKDNYFGIVQHLLNEVILTDPKGLMLVLVSNLPRNASPQSRIALHKLSSF